MRPEVVWATSVILLGGIGTWLLLPHRLGRLKPRRVQGFGSLFSMLAVILLARFYVPIGPFLQSAFFYAFATAAVSGAILTVTSRDPVASALWFASVVLSVSGLFLLAGAQFLAAGTVIVYAGAIIVTFLFVIMLAQSEGMATYDRMSRAPGSATLSGFLLLWAVYFALLTMRPETKPGVSPPPNPLIPAAALIKTDSNPGGRVLPNDTPAIVLRRSVPATSQLRDVVATEAPLGTPPAHMAGLGGTLFTDHLLAVELSAPCSSWRSSAPSRSQRPGRRSAPPTRP